MGPPRACPARRGLGREESTRAGARAMGGVRNPNLFPTQKVWGSKATPSATSSPRQPQRGAAYRYLRRIRKLEMHTSIWTVHRRRSRKQMSTSDEIIALRQGYQARRAERQAQEREQALKELREDPRDIGAVRQGERERAAREAGAEARRRSEAEQRESEARVRLEREKERKRRLWIASGNPVESFERHWPEIEKQILIENYRASGRYESII